MNYRQIQISIQINLQIGIQIIIQINIQISIQINIQIIIQINIHSEQKTSVAGRWCVYSEHQAEIPSNVMITYLCKHGVVS